MLEKYDIAIIGSGLGGLTCGYILAKNGYKVALFEKNKKIGGSLQTFSRGGTKFETGMHYIGSIAEGSPLHTYFDYLSIFDNVQFSQLDKDGYDIISLDGKRYSFCNEHEHFINGLSKHFPKERLNISKYLSDIEDIVLNSPLYSFENTGSLDTASPRIDSEDAYSFIAKHSDNLLLRNILAGQLPLYGGVKGKTPAYIHALITEFYMKGAYRVIGGSDMIALSLEHSIKSFGGEIFTLSEVTSIDCDMKKAVGITLKGSERVFADTIISDVHPQVTLNMIDSGLIRRVFRERIANLEHTISNFTVYLKFEKERVPYMNKNFFHYNNNQVWGNERYAVADWPQNFVYMHVAPSSERPVYAEGAEIISYMRWDEVAKWSDTHKGQRGEEYEEFKRERAMKLIDSLEEQFPCTKANIDSFYTSSPLTYKDYLGTKEGSVYGIIRDVRTMPASLVSHRTKIPNLIFTGQNTNAHGIIGVIISAVIACSDLLGTDFLMKQIKKS